MNRSSSRRSKNKIVPALILLVVLAAVAYFVFLKSDNASKINQPATVASGTATPFTKTISIGSEGDDVKSLLQFLSDNSVYKGKVSTVFDSSGSTALRKFQTDHQLSSSGTFDTSTMSYLNNFLSGNLGTSGDTFSARAAIPNAKDMTVRVTVNPAFPNHVIHANIPHTKIGSYIITNNQPTPVKLTAVRSTYTTGGVPLSNFNRLYTEIDGTVVSSTTHFLVGSVTLSGLTVQIPAGATKTVDYYTDTGSATSGTLITSFMATVYGGPLFTTLLCDISLSAMNNPGCQTSYRVGSYVSLVP